MYNSLNCFLFMFSSDSMTSVCLSSVHVCVYNCSKNISRYNIQKMPFKKNLNFLIICYSAGKIFAEILVMHRVLIIML